jgi:hypothetical protein
LYHPRWWSLICHLAERLQPALILVRPDETLIIILRDKSSNLLPDILAHYQALGKLLANVIFTLRAVIKPSLDNTRPDRAAAIDQPGIFGHAAIAQDTLRRQAEAEVFEPAIAKLLLVGGTLFDIGLISQAKVTAITTAS